ncbi:Transposon Tf2-9 polyprotein [Nymphaea thermarum]|nr:Transposon Tf2-9 polyprotein [Nymphaea thermarum]
MPSSSADWIRRALCLQGRDLEFDPCPLPNTSAGLCIGGDKAVVPPDSGLKQELLQHFHDTPAAGDEGVAMTLSRIKAQFWWRGIKAEVQAYVKKCTVCQREKYEAIKPPGHLNPLPIPTRPWTDVTMDFIDAMPRSDP